KLRAPDAADSPRSCPACPRRHFLNSWHWATVAAAARLTDLSAGLTCGTEAAPTPWAAHRRPPGPAAACVQLRSPLDDQAVSLTWIVSVGGFVTCPYRCSQGPPCWSAACWREQDGAVAEFVPEVTG